MSEMCIRDHGKTLIDNGYIPVPIKPGDKACVEPKWGETKGTYEEIDAWVAEGKGHYGVGVITRDYPAIDIDVPHEGIAKLLVEFVKDSMGGVPILQRVGFAPKILIPCRTESRFGKRFTKEYWDEKGWGKKKHQIEILTNGYYVAFGMHPGEKNPIPGGPKYINPRPYEWLGGKSILDVKAKDLPLFTQKQIDDLFTYFYSLVPSDWNLKKKEKKEQKKSFMAKGRLSAVSKVVRAPGLRSPSMSIEELIARAVPKNNVSTGEPKTGLYPPPDAEEVNYILNLLDPDMEEIEWVKKGMALYHGFDRPDADLDLAKAMFISWSKGSNKYKPEDAKRWDGFKFDPGANPGVDPTTLGSLLTKKARALYAMYKEYMAPGVSQEEPKPMFTQTWGEFEDLEGPSNWLIEGLLEPHTMAMLFGATGEYKSFLALDLALCCLTGKAWNGRKVQKGAVVYMAGEAKQTIAKNVRAWQTLHSFNIPKDAHFHVNYVTPNLVAAESAAAIGLQLDETVKATGEGPVLVVIDTLATCFGGKNENDTADMNAFVNNIKTCLMDRHQATVLVVHHSGRQEKHRARGASSMDAALDCTYHITKQSHLIMKIKNTKMRNAAPGVIFLQGEVVDSSGASSGQGSTSVAFRETDYKQEVEGGDEGGFAPVYVDARARIFELFEAEAKDGRISIGSFAQLLVDKKLSTTVKLAKALIRRMAGECGGIRYHRETKELSVDGVFGDL